MEMFILRIGLLMIFYLIEWTICESIDNVVLSTYSNYPNQSLIKKFKFDDHIKDPVCGDFEERLAYNELLNISKELEPKLAEKAAKNGKLAQFMPVELFCVEMHPIFKCLLRTSSNKITKYSHLDLNLNTTNGLTWLVYEGSYAKVAAGYMTTPSNGINWSDPNTSGDEKYSIKEKNILHVRKNDTLIFDDSSEFKKFFRPKSTSMSDFRVYFHGNGIYDSGWLEDGTTVQVAIKSLVRTSSYRNNYLWDREREYTIFLSSSELWRSSKGYINFVPGVFSLYSIKNLENNRLKGNNYLNSKNVISELLIPDCKSKEDHYSEFLIMEYSKGIRFHELTTRLKSSPAVYYYSLTNDWQDWFKNAIYLVYMGLSIISTFSTTGRYLYTHCDLHGDNIIIPTISGKFSRIIFTNMRKLMKLEDIKIIDHMFVWTPKSVGNRNHSNPCTDIQDVSLSDIECFTALLLGPLFRWDYYPFDNLPEQTDSYLEISKKSIDFFNHMMNIPEWRRISSYYIGGATEWFKKWKRFGTKDKDNVINTFNEQFEGIMLACDYLQYFLFENGIPQEDPCVQFHAYIRGYTMLNYRAMRIGYCIKKNIKDIFDDVENNDVKIKYNIQISYWDLSRLTLLFYWNLLASNIEYCLPISYTKNNYVFQFNDKYKLNLNERHCKIIKDCLNEEDNIFNKKYANLQKVNINILKYNNVNTNGTSTLKNTYNSFMKYINNIDYKNFNINENNRSLKDLKFETLIKLNGKIGSIISNKASNIIETQKMFDYEEFLLDRWIFNLYYQSSFSLSFTLIGLRYSFRIEPNLTGQRGLIDSFMKLLKKSAHMQNFLFGDNGDISETNLLKSCEMFYKVYYEIAIKIYLNQNKNCKIVIDKILNDPNYILFKKNNRYLGYYKEVKDSFFQRDGKQKLMIINSNNICSYDYFDLNSNITPNSGIIYQGFCNILIKPLNHIKIRIK